MIKAKKDIYIYKSEGISSLGKQEREVFPKLLYIDMSDEMVRYVGELLRRPCFSPIEAVHYSEWV